MKRLFLILLIISIGCGDKKPKVKKAAHQNDGGPTLLTSGQKAKAVVKGTDQKGAKKAVNAMMLIPPFNPNARSLPPEAFTEQGKENRDPFRNFYAEAAENPGSESLEAEDEGIVLLERYDLSQLSLTGIVWSAGREKALIRDPQGQPTVVHKGDIISKSRAWVKEITHDRVILSIPTGDPEQKEKLVELRLHSDNEGISYQIQYDRLRADQRGIRIHKGRRTVHRRKKQSSERRNEP